VSDPDVSFAKLDRAGDERFQSLRRPLEGRSLGINVLTLQPGQRGRVHAHAGQEEYYLVLEGRLTLAVEGVEHELGVDDIARVGPTTRRQLVNRSPARVVLLALGAAGEHEPRDASAWHSWEEEGEGHPPQEVPFPADLPPG
jgi:mannose-6-phosphate isomerase-like protein (cupin superfamily)